METFRNILRHHVLSDIHLWVAGILVAQFIATEVLEPPWPEPLRPLRGPFHLVVICIAIILTDRLKESAVARQNNALIEAMAKRLGETTVSSQSDAITTGFIEHPTVRQLAMSVEATARAVIRMEQALSADGARLYERPRTDNEFDELWGGMSGEYCAYNPSYRLEDLLGKDGQEQAVARLIQRYRAKNFKRARYLFLTGDDAGRDDLRSFRRYMKEVHKAVPAVEQLVEVHELKEKGALHEAEVYIGVRHGRPAAIVEMTGSALGGKQRGAPDYYLDIHDKDAIDHLQKAFDDHWPSSDRLSLF